MSVWVYRHFPDNTGVDRSVIQIGDEADQYNRPAVIHYNISDDLWYFRHRRNNSYDPINLAPSTIPQNTWVHVAMTWDKAADAVIAYVDGTQQGPTVTAPGTWSGVGVETFKIGRKTDVTA